MPTSRVGGVKDSTIYFFSVCADVKSAVLKILFGSSEELVLKIATRILLSLGVLFTLLLLNGLNGWRGLEGARDHIGRLVSTSQYRNDVNEIRAMALQVEGAVSEFRRTGAPEILDQVARALGKANSGLAMMMEKAGPAEKPRLERLAAQMLAYARSLEKAARFDQQARALISGPMRVGGEKINTQLQELLQTAMDLQDRQGIATASMGFEQTLNGRLMVLKYILNQDETLYEKAEEGFNLAVLSLGAITRTNPHEKLRTLAGEIVEGIGDYRMEFSDIEELLSDRNLEMSKTMEPLGVEVLKMLNEQSSRAKTREALILEAVDGEMATAEWLTLIILGVSFVVALIAGVMLSRSVTLPVRALTSAMKSLSDGDLEVGIPGLQRKDQLGEMAQTLLVFRDKSREVERLKETQRLAEGRAESERRAALVAIADELESTLREGIEEVHHSVSQVGSSVGDMGARSKETLAQSSQVAFTTKQAAHNVDAVAKAASELSEQIAGITQSLERAAGGAKAATERADSARQTMGRLQEAAEMVGSVVGLIKDISENTGLLALNATIEAARAGEMGKGFAVVADEVKTLAQQTGKATDEISRLVGLIQSTTREAVSAIGAVSHDVSALKESTDNIAEAIRAQDEATRSISAHIDEISAGSQGVAESLGRVDAAACETREGADAAISAVTSLDQQAEDLKGQVMAITARVRAQGTNTGVPEARL